jgi:septal ring factor EnvC (AmiA/AmiB activator)
MTRASKVVVLLVVLALGIWGCAKGPANQAGQLKRLRELESHCAKLEQDFQTAAAARDQARKQAEALEEEKAQLDKDLAGRANVAKERDQLQQQLKVALAEREELRGQLEQRTGERDEARQLVGARTEERDGWQARHERFRKGVQSLLTQDEPQSPTAPTTSPAESAPPTMQPANGQS